MKFSAAFLAALFSTAAVAAPAPAADAAQAEGVSQMVASAPQWTIVNMKRPCNAANTVCTWSFSINRNNGIPPVACTFQVKGNNASQTGSTGNVCGGFTVSSGWSGQFGPGNGFTTLAVVQNKVKQIIYPAYTDKELANGATVSPNKSYTPQNLP